MELLTTAPRGTQDVLPEEVYKWRHVEHVARSVARDFGFMEIRFPTFEHTELFLRGVGDTTDVVQKEMYTFLDKGGRSVSLRPEGTASVVRSYLEHSLYAGGLPVKVFYIAPNFRYEKPQAGRLREHHQFGVECFGAQGPEADAEVIGLAAVYIARLGLRQVSLELNSIGCPECRPRFHDALRAYFQARESELCGTCKDRLSRNPLRILDCKNEVCAQIAKDAPVVTDYLCADCGAHLADVTRYLAAMGISCRLNPRIVRGLDYYTRTVFEFVSAQIGAQGTILGGGRYDGLVSALGGSPTAGLGFGSGIERMLLTMEAEGAAIPEPAGFDLFVAALGGAADEAAQVLVHALRQRGVSAQRDLTGRGLKAQMKYANRIRARYSMVLGENELATGTANLKDMSTGKEISCTLTPEAIASAIKPSL